jgi:hypothetical protein
MLGQRLELGHDQREREDARHSKARILIVVATPVLPTAMENVAREVDGTRR